MMVQERCSYIKKSTTPMSRPPGPQMISPSPTCSRRRTTPRTPRPALTVTRSSSRTEGNLEGQKRVTSYKCKEVSRSVGVTVWRPEAQVPGCRQSPPSPCCLRSKGMLRLRVCSSRSLPRPATVSTGSCSPRPSEDSAQAFRQEPKRIEERVVKSQSKIQSS